MRSNQDQQLFALKKQFGTNLDWIKVKVPLTHYEVEKYFGPQCKLYDHLCPCCRAWEEWHNTNYIVSVYLSRADILQCLDGELENIDDD